MMLDNRAESVKGPVMLHFPSWYQATHGGYVAFNFNSLVKYHPDISTPRVGNKFLWNPRTFDQQTFEDYDYYVLKGPFRLSSFPFDDSGENFELLYREGDWHLFSLREKTTSQTEYPYHSTSSVE